jgi:HAD superfamily hydrolase (TIGR01549 family)
MVKAIIFDWGNTLMRDFTEYPGPMAYWEKIEVIEGVESLLKSLQQNYILCVATNAGDSDTSLMIKALERGNIKQYFNYFFSSKDLGYAKPDPMFFKTIADKMKVIPQECLMIGNDYNKDIEGALSIGMKTIHFNETKTELNNTKADFTVSKINQLLETLEKIKD